MSVAVKIESHWRRRYQKVEFCMPAGVENRSAASSLVVFVNGFIGFDAKQRLRPPVLGRMTVQGYTKLDFLVQVPWPQRKPPQNRSDFPARLPPCACKGA